MTALIQRLRALSERRAAAAETIGHAETAALTRQDAADVSEAVAIIERGMGVGEQHKATCETNGHLFGAGGVCIFCSTPKPDTPTPLVIMDPSQAGEAQTLNIPLSHYERGLMSRALGWEPSTELLDDGEAAEYLRGYRND